MENETPVHNLSNTAPAEGRDASQNTEDQLPETNVPRAKDESVKPLSGKDEGKTEENKETYPKPGVPVIKPGLAASVVPPYNPIVQEG